MLHPDYYDNLCDLNVKLFMLKPVYEALKYSVICEMLVTLNNKSTSRN